MPSEDEMELLKRQRKLAKKEKKMKEDMKLEKILRKEEKVPDYAFFFPLPFNWLRCAVSLRGGRERG